MYKSVDNFCTILYLILCVTFIYKSVYNPVYTDLVYSLVYPDLVCNLVYTKLLIRHNYNLLYNPAYLSVFCDQY